MNQSTKAQTLHASFLNSAKPSSSPLTSEPAAPSEGGFVKASDLITQGPPLIKNDTTKEATETAVKKTVPRTVTEPAFVSASKLISSLRENTIVNGEYGPSSAKQIHREERKNHLRSSPTVSSNSEKLVGKMSPVSKDRRGKKLEKLASGSSKITSFFDK